MMDQHYTKVKIRSMVSHMVFEKISIIMFFFMMSIFPNGKYDLYTLNISVCATDNSFYSFNYQLYLGIFCAVEQILLLICLVILIYDLTTSIIKFIWIIYIVALINEALVFAIMFTLVIISPALRFYACYKDIFNIVSMVLCIICGISELKAIRKIVNITKRIKEHNNPLQSETETDIES